MKNTQLAKMASNGRVKLFLQDHEAVLVLIILYPPLRDALILHMSNLGTSVQKQEEDIKLWAKTKKLSKRAMTDCVMKYVMRAYLQADQLGLTDVAMALNKVQSYIYQTAAAVAVARAKDLVKIINDNSAELTVILPADIAEMEAAIQDYSDLVDVPKSEIEKKKAEGTAQIEAIQKLIDKDKEDIGKLVQSYLPELADDYENAAKVGKPAGTKNLSMMLHVTDAVGGNNLRNAYCRATNGSEILDVSTGEKGFAKFFSLEGGLWNVLVQKKDYGDFKQNEVVVSEGKIVKMEVKIKKNTLPDMTEGSFLLTVFDEATGTKLPGLTLTLPSIDKNYTSNINGEFAGDNLVVASYAGFISGNDILTKAISFMIEAGKTSKGSFGVEKV